ncbi:MAG: hypothetical protein IPH10_07785 [bacterium]|nr:hypothetical protein [bacterium]
MTSIDSELLAILVCPLSKSTLIEHGDALVSTDRATRRAYSFVEGIPDLLIEHARELPQDEWEVIMRAAGKLP